MIWPSIPPRLRRSPSRPQHAYHPIIYVRGFAATQGEIEETVADPYMGFNIGSTKVRLAWTGEVRRFYFESPLVRLMSDHGYQNVFVEGDDQVAPADFRVHLVAHSMGGLVCRAFLQNPALGAAEARAAVDKLFTYATPHNGIDMRIVRNVPGWLSFGDVNNFNRDRMAAYLDLPRGDEVSVVKGFPPERIFNLIGTNPGDYTVAGGISAWAAGEASDGICHAMLTFALAARASAPFHGD